MSKLTLHYLALNGIPFSDHPDAATAFFWRDPQGAWLPNHGNHLSQVEELCVKLHDTFAEKIFGTKGAYWE
jgi:hypothetical protein